MAGRLRTAGGNGMVCHPGKATNTMLIKVPTTTFALRDTTAAAAEDVFRLGRISTHPHSCFRNQLLFPPLPSEIGFVFLILGFNFVGSSCQTAGFIPACFSFRVMALRFVVGSTDERRVNSDSGGRSLQLGGMFIQLFVLSHTHKDHSSNTHN